MLGFGGQGRSLGHERAASSSERFRFGRAGRGFAEHGGQTDGPEAEAEAVQKLAPRLEIVGRLGEVVPKKLRIELVRRFHNFDFRSAVS